MGKTAADLMQTSIVTVTPDDPLHIVQRLLHEEGIHGAPVVDEQGKLRGIITSTDILRGASEAHDGEPVYFAQEPEPVPGWGMGPEDFKERLQGTSVADLMTEELIQVSPSTPVGQIAKTLLAHRVHRALVVERGKLCGIVSAFDLIALLAEG